MTKSDDDELFDFSDLDELMVGLVADVEELSEIKKITGQERIDDEENLVELREIIKSIVPDDSSDSRTDLQSAFNHLLAEFDIDMVGSLSVKCQHLVDTHGFEAFQQSFDKILMDKHLVNAARFNIRYAYFIRTINQFINNKVADTFSAIILEGAKIQAKGILDAHLPPQEITDEEAYVKEVSECAGVLKSKQKFFLPMSAQNMDLVSRFIRRDILAQDKTMTPGNLLKLRTLKLERYIRIADTLKDKHAEAAMAVMAAVNSSEIKRLGATFTGLSITAQGKHKAMTHLFAPDNSFGALSAHVAQHNDYIPQAIIARDMDSLIVTATSETQSRAIQAKTIKVRIDRLLTNSEHVDKIEPVKEVDPLLRAQILREKIDLNELPLAEAEAKERARKDEEKQVQDGLYDVSIQLEPRNIYMRPARMERYEILMQPIELNKQLHSMIKYYSYKKSDRLIAECQNLIETYGFSAFDLAFDAILASNELSSRRQHAAMKLINREIVDIKFQTYVDMVAKAGTQYASEITHILDQPDQALVDKVRAEAGFAAGKEITPYDLEKYRRNELHKPAKKLFETYNALSIYVVSDILSKTSLDERTIAYERYILLVAKMIDTGNIDAAFQVFGALSSSAITRLKVSFMGLSEHAQAEYKKMGDLFAPNSNYSALEKECRNKGVHFPVNLDVTRVTFTLESNELQKGQDIKPVKELSGIKKVKNNLQLILDEASRTIAEPNQILVKEIHAIQGRIADSKKGDDPLYNISLEREPRTHGSEEIKGSKVIPGLKRVLSAGLYESIQSEKNEKKIRDLDKIESSMQRIRLNVLQRNKNDAPDVAEKKVHAQTLFSNIINRVANFVAESKLSLMQKIGRQNDTVMLASMSDEGLRDYMDQVVDDLCTYHEKHGGTLEDVAHLSAQIKSSNQIIGYSGGIEGQKAFYTAKALFYLQAFMEKGFTAESENTYYKKLVDITNATFMQHSSRLNKLSGKEPTLIRTIRETIVPVIEELARRKGYEMAPVKEVTATEVSKSRFFFFKEKAQELGSQAHDKDQKHKIPPLR